MEATMNISDEAIRKAAILVAALDTAAADALLESMDEQLAARVRASYMELVNVDEAEQQRVIEQFMGGGAKCEEAATLISPAKTSVMLDELTLSSAIPLADYLSNNRPIEDTQHASALASEASEQRIFSFLEAATGEELAVALKGEHPQTIAVVLANVEPATAGAALARLSPAQQADVARRIADLRQIDGDALAELQTALRESLGGRFSRSSAQPNGRDALQRIWSEATAADKSALEKNLRQREASLLSTLVAASGMSASPEPATSLPVATETNVGERVRNKHPITPTMSFEALSELDSASLERVLQKAEGRTLLLALAGASPAFIEQVYRQLPKREAQLLRRQIEQQGPIVLRDVTEAQRRVAVIASRLAAAGEIQVPGARRFPIAA